MNDAGGKWSDERGLAHAMQLIESYEAPIADFQHQILAITINLGVVERSIYESVRYAWRLDPVKARKADYVLAVHKGLIVGAFIAKRWLQVTPENFPERGEIRPKRWGFEGDEAPTEIQRAYLRHRLPDAMRKRGAANPIKYTY
jgi:hypothetical protein